MIRKHIPMNIQNELNKIKTCANHPNINAPGCKGYICPLWKNGNGLFDESGLQIDHIIEITHGGTNDINNLQTLCPCCHSVKTKRCSKQLWHFNSIELDQGVAYMETNIKKKRKIVIVID